MKGETLPAAVTVIGQSRLGLLEARLREVVAILGAIRDGALFESRPAALADRERHITGLALLEMVEARAREALDLEGVEGC